MQDTALTMPTLVALVCLQEVVNFLTSLRTPETMTVLLRVLLQDFAVSSRSRDEGVGPSNTNLIRRSIEGSNRVGHQKLAVDGVDVARLYLDTRQYMVNECH